ncbi:MAG: hypothetical protein KAR40_14710 [Candidatus Sabulitectum sp.]|nr:hypothetical protein [Candidatus Sabulitectum sp.]
MSALVVIFHLLLLGSGSDLDYGVGVVEDRFEGFTKTYMSHNLIPNEPGLPIRLDDIVATGLGAMVIEYEEGETSFLIFAEISSEDWLFLSRVNLLLNDTTRVCLDNPLEPVRDVFNGICCERVMFEVEPQLIWEIALADTVEIKLSGDDYYRIRALSPVNVQRFYEFAMQYIPET